jgi:hypothetical protein
LIGKGHGTIRATHDKTLEFSPDPEITERATCIVAVGAEAVGTDSNRLPGRLAGPIRITISAGAESFEFEALANPGWTPGGPAVVRRSDRRLPGTLATEATASAADLPRSLVAALRDPAATVEVTLHPIAGRRFAVLAALDPDGPPDPRLSAEISAADVVVAEDAEAARLLGERAAAGSVTVAGRVVVVATRNLPGATVARELRDVDVDVLGLPPGLAAAAASPSRAPLVVADGRDPRPLLHSVPAMHRLVLATTADEVPALLALAAEARGVDGAVLVAPHARPRRVTSTSPTAGRDVVHLCLDAAIESSALDPRFRQAVRTLLADGVPTKTAASALAVLTGWERRRAYDTVLGWRVR